MFSYKKALCRRIPKSIVDGGIRLDNDHKPLDYQLAVEQHGQMMKALESLGVKVTVLETDELTPDCVFVEDPAVVIDDIALITNPGADARKAETAPLKTFFQNNEPNLKIVEMEAPAELDGGDVLFTGYEIFVGLSARTNQEGLEFLAKVFKKYPVHGIAMENSTLHLKSVMSMGEQDVILCGKSPDACKMLKILLEKATRIYSVLRTPDDKGANGVILNGKLLCRSRADLPGSFDVLSKLTVPKIELSATELSKVDGCLTCVSLLYN